MKKRQDSANKPISAGDIVENWQGRRCVAHYEGKTCILRDDAGDLKTPVRVIATAGTPEAEHTDTSNQGMRPSWYLGMQKR